MPPHNLKNTAPSHVHARKRTHTDTVVASLIENAAGEFSVSHCFMNSIYKVLAVCAALLVVSSGCAVVKVMTGCEYKRKNEEEEKKKKKAVHENATTPSWPRLPLPTALPREQLPRQKSCLPSPEKSVRRNLSYFITPLLSPSHPQFFFKKLMRGLIDVEGDLAAALIKQH